MKREDRHEPKPPTLRDPPARDIYLENLRESYRRRRAERLRLRRRSILLIVGIIILLVLACIADRVLAGEPAAGVSQPPARVTAALEPTRGWEPTDSPAVVELALEHWIRVAKRHPLGVRVYRLEVARAIADGAEAHDLPAELVTAMALRESSGRQDARGRAGELGLLQVHPDTAVRFRCRLGTPGEQVDCGCRVLARHLARCGTLRGALAAYGSRSGSCTPPRGGSVERMVNDRMRLAAELRAVMDGGPK
jgi:hypothetical protein